jgi:2',3'-cyclic-nucleotide 2'-phosphodiesterase (5'-nucleotidase family)
LIDPMEAAGTYLPALKREGADVLIALTHLTFADDRELVRRFPEITLVVGGHEHYPITAVENGTLISKAGSDAKFVGRIDLNRRADGTLERFFELIPIVASIPDEPRAAAVVAEYENRLGRELDVVVGNTTTDLDADSVRMRASETNMGNFFADAMRADAGADIAIVNSGGIRGDRIYPAGPLSRRTLVAIHPFGGVVCKLEMSGRDIVTALEAGVSRLPASDGRFPQISGMTMTVRPAAPAGQRVSNVMVAGAPIDPAKMYTVAATDYQIEGGDGYGIFTTQKVLLNPETGPLIVNSLEKYVSARRTINPAKEGRIRIE